MTATPDEPLRGTGAGRSQRRATEALETDIGITTHRRQNTACSLN